MSLHQHDPDSKAGQDRHQPSRARRHAVALRLLAWLFFLAAALYAYTVILLGLEDGETESHYTLSEFAVDVGSALLISAPGWVLLVFARRAKSRP